MFLRILKKDLRRKKTMNIILFLFIIMCSMFASASVNNIMAVNGGIEHYFDMSDMYDVEVSIPKASDAEERIRSLPDVTDVKTSEYLAMESPRYWKYNGETMTNFINPAVLYPADNMHIKYFDDKNHVIESVEKGTFYSTKVFTMDTDIKPGDTVVLEVGDLKLSLTYAGRMKGADVSTDKYGNPVILLNREDYTVIEQEPEVAKLKTLGGADKMQGLYVHTSNPQAVIDIVDEFPEGYYIERDTYKTLYLYDMITAYIMMAISILLMVVAFVMLRFTIGFTISEEYREIGVMKAVGIDNGSIRRLYIVKYLAIAIVASFIGFFCSIPVGNAMTDAISNNIVLENKTGSASGVFSTIVVIAIILLFCYLCTRKVKKLSPIDAVRNGQTGERFGKKSLMKLGRSHLPSTGFMAVNDVLSAKKRFFLIAVIFGLSLLLVTSMSNFVTTLQSDEITWSFGIPESDVTILDTETLMKLFMDDGTVLDDVRQMLADNGMPAKLNATMMDPCVARLNDKAEQIGLVYSLGDLSYTPKIIDGRVNEKADEVIMTPSAMKLLDAEIGDTFTAEIGDETYDFIITGTYESFMTQSALLNGSFDTSILQPNGGMGIQVKFDGSPSKAQIKENVKKMRKLIGSDQVLTNSEMIKSVTGMADTLDSVKNMMMLLTIIIAVMIVILMERSFISREKSEIALMKAMGITDRSIIWQHTLRFIIVSIVACLLATAALMPVSNVFMNMVCGMIGDVKSITCDVNAFEVYGLFPIILIAVSGLGAFFTALYTKSVKASDTASIE